MVDLNEEQRHTVSKGEPLRIVDPLTHGAYVLVRSDVYSNLDGDLPRPG
jgi:hypothetical protein